MAIKSGLSSSNKSDIWWEQIKPNLGRFNNLTVARISDDEMDSLAELVQRSMQLQCTIQDGDIWLTDSNSNAHISLNYLMTH